MTDFDSLFEDMGDVHRFEPKLTVRQRCEILAFLRRGVRASVLRKVYSVSDRTVKDIGRDSSRHYKAIRAEYDDIGRDAFERKHLEESVVRQVMLHQKHRSDRPGGDNPTPRPDPVRPTIYNPKANARKGHHHFDDVYGYETTVTIDWGRHVDGSPEAWYYQEEGSLVWVGPFYTSTSALEGAKTGKTQSQLDGH